MEIFTKHNHFSQAIKSLEKSTRSTSSMFLIKPPRPKVPVTLFVVSSKHIQGNICRKVVAEYSIETRKFLMLMLELISEGMGLESQYFEGEITKNQSVSVNHHIPCPDPSLTMGMQAHCDPNLISMIHQSDVCGLQALKDGQWVGVEPITGAFVVIPGIQLRVISNGKLASAVHRVVTDSKESRTTIGVFLIPSNDILIRPADGLVGSSPMYRGYTYNEFFSTFTGNNCDADVALECYKL